VIIDLASNVPHPRTPAGAAPVRNHARARYQVVSALRATKDGP